MLVPLYLVALVALMACGVPLYLALIVALVNACAIRWAWK
jgi:hypothetical protein